jgi:putative nucleotidyltransferase with HDIG domain
MGTLAGFHLIALGALRADSVAQCDLYLLPPGGKTCVLYREKHVPIAAHDLVSLRDSGVNELYVRKAEIAALHRYLEEHIADILHDGTVLTEEKASILYECSCGVVASLFRDPRVQGMVDRARKIAEHAVDFLEANEDAFGCLLRLASRDYYTYTHSVNVAILSVSFAQGLGYDSRGFLQCLAEGALLHDVGKSAIEGQVLKMPGKLSHTQWLVMRKHPELAVQMLQRHGKLDPAATSIVRHHHEKLDGSGYPDGLRNGQIPRPVRMVTITDIYDALTTNRCYRKALHPVSALDKMRTEMAEELDLGYLERFSVLVKEALPDPAPQRSALAMTNQG